MIAVSNLRKSFGGTQVLKDVSFEVQSHSICAIVGPTACGKSTLLNIIAHLDTPDSGSIQPETQRRPGYMMQDALLLPWRNLEENATLGTEVAAGGKPAPDQLDSLFHALGLAKDRNKYPSMASGGMKQRLSLLRTLLLQPSLLLMDEPFSSLDFDIKLNVQKFLLDYHVQHDSTILWVTHDIDDAIAISDRVIVLSDKPAKVKAEFPIDLGISKRSPVEARKSSKFRDYFAQIWDQLRYLEKNDAD